MPCERIIFLNMDLYVCGGQVWMQTKVDKWQKGQNMPVYEDFTIW